MALPRLELGPAQTGGGELGVQIIDQLSMTRERGCHPRPPRLALVN